MSETTFAFTTERLRNLQPQAQRFEVRDATTPGLMCRVTPAGVKTLCFYRWVPRSKMPERITIGKFPATSIDAARKRCAAIWADVALDKSPARERQAIRAESTLAEVWAKYETEHLPRLAAKTSTDTKTLWATHVPDKLKSRRLGDIEHGDLSGLHASLGKTHKRTANKVAGLVRALYRAAARWGYAGANPAAGVQHFAIASRERFLLPQELDQFLAEVQASPEPFNRLWRLLLLTGVRLDNMLSARWEQFDLAAGLWQVPGSSHKNRQPHALPLLPDAVALLQEQRAWLQQPKRRASLPARAAPFVFASATNKTGHMTHPSIRREWLSLCERAEVPGLWRHDLRRTVGSYMAMQGASLPMIGKALGHRSVQATQIYARLVLEPVRDAMAGALAGVARPAAPKPIE
jgi:integrase